MKNNRFTSLLSGLSVTVTTLCQSTGYVFKGRVMCHTVSRRIPVYTRAQASTRTRFLFLYSIFHNVYDYICMTYYDTLCRSVVVRLSGVTLCVTESFLSMTQHDTAEKGDIYEIS